MSLIKVKYVGKGDSITTEFDGVKYNFSKAKPVQMIPLEVYNFFQERSNPFREELVPVTEQEVKEEPKEVAPEPGQKPVEQEKKKKKK